MTKEKDVIQYEVADNGIATIWLNRPHKRNCVSPQLLKELEKAVIRAEADEKALVVVFRGRGNTFCSGADLDQLVGPVLHTSTQSMQLGIDSARTYDRIYNMKKPTVAAVEGYAVAGGFELLISCDFCLAADEARIGDFHIRRALFGGAGPIYRLPRYIGMRRAKELMLTGKLLSGKECAEWGLANASAPASRIRPVGPGFLCPHAGAQSILHVDDQVGGQSGPGCRYRYLDGARTHDVQRRAPFARRQGRRRGISGEEKAKLDRHLVACNSQYGSERRWTGRAECTKRAASNSSRIFARRATQQSAVPVRKALLYLAVTGH